MIMTVFAAECRRKRVESGIVRTLRRLGRPLTAGQLLFLGPQSIRAAERDIALAALVAAGLVTAGEATGPRRRASAVFRVYSLARPAQPAGGAS
jgi:hypothetical protein